MAPKMRPTPQLSHPAIMANNVTINAADAVLVQNDEVALLINQATGRLKVRIWPSTSMIIACIAKIMNGPFHKPVSHHIPTCLSLETPAIPSPNSPNMRHIKTVTNVRTMAMVKGEGNNVRKTLIKVDEKSLLS